MSKFINRKKRKKRSKEEILQLIKQNKKELILDEYVFQYGMKSGLVKECNNKYSTEHFDLIKNILLK